MVTKSTNAHTCIKVSYIINKQEAFYLYNIRYFYIHLPAFVYAVTTFDHLTSFFLPLVVFNSVVSGNGLERPT
jgi:hypothetical protein